MTEQSSTQLNGSSAGYMWLQEAICFQEGADLSRYGESLADKGHHAQSLYARNDAIYRAHREGVAAKDIADALDLTEEKVQSIIKH